MATPDSLSESSKRWIDLAVGYVQLITKAFALFLTIDAIFLYTLFHADFQTRQLEKSLELQRVRLAYCQSDDLLSNGVHLDPLLSPSQAITVIPLQESQRTQQLLDKKTQKPVKEGAEGHAVKQDGLTIAAMPVGKAEASMEKMPATAAESAQSKTNVNSEKSSAISDYVPAEIHNLRQIAETLESDYVNVFSLAAHYENSMLRPLINEVSNRYQHYWKTDKHSVDIIYLRALSEELEKYKNNIEVIRKAWQKSVGFRDLTNKQIQSLIRVEEVAPIEKGSKPLSDLIFKYQDLKSSKILTREFMDIHAYWVVEHFTVRSDIPVDDQEMIRNYRSSLFSKYLENVARAFKGDPELSARSVSDKISGFLKDEDNVRSRAGFTLPVLGLVIDSDASIVSLYCIVIGGAVWVLILVQNIRCCISNLETEFEKKCGQTVPTTCVVLPQSWMDWKGALLYLPILPVVAIAVIETPFIRNYLGYTNAPLLQLNFWLLIGVLILSLFLVTLTFRESILAFRELRHLPSAPSPEQPTNSPVPQEEAGEK